MIKKDDIGLIMEKNLEEAGKKTIKMLASFLQTPLKQKKLQKYFTNLPTY
jgi:hypothetical protein